MSIFSDWAKAREAEDERIERIFAERHSEEMLRYYSRERSIVGLSCVALEAAAPERGVYSDALGTVVASGAASAARMRKSIGARKTNLRKAA